MLIAAIVFLASLLSILCLFGLKHWEEKRSTVLVPGFRLWSDEQALKVQAFLAWCSAEADKLPPLMLRIATWCVHELALGFASLARSSERQAHRLADLVSHKHRFERREPKNEFLKQVGEYKNGSDTFR